jgi:hypothetical protein
MRLHPFGTPGRHLQDLKTALPSYGNNSNNNNEEERGQKYDDDMFGQQLPVSEILSGANESGVPLMLQRQRTMKKTTVETAGTRDTSQPSSSSSSSSTQAEQTHDAGAAEAAAFSSIAEVR